MTAVDERLSALRRFYELLDDLERRIGGKRTFTECRGDLNWPARGVYFIFEQGETRTDTGAGLRVVRVGTHALTAQSSTTLWNRLSQHRGTKTPKGGNHRGSIFRLLVGTAILHGAEQLNCRTWGSGSSVSRDVRAREQPIEAIVSETIGSMRLLWLSVDDPPGPDSLRGMIERNAIALLSNFERPVLDPPSAQWLGLKCSRDRVRRSGLWNSNHVDETFSIRFLDDLARLIERAS